MKTSQAWSMDIMIAVVIFIGVIFVFYSIFSSNRGSKIEELEEDALIVLKNINITQNISQLEQLLEEEYPDLKKKLRIVNEFCIYLEDEDGNVIYINPNDPSQLGIGSSDIEIAGEGCR